MTFLPHTARGRNARRLVHQLALAIGAAGCGIAAAQTQVGQVSLVIGEAHVIRADGQRDVLRRGAGIGVGDRIQTAGNGHVHVRFVDNGVVSVRPESMLEVQAYRYDARDPAASEVRLKLDHGASRSISGAATAVDKSRFRLNTPIAAIGVRGTDFVVYADPDGVRATVAQGAIVVGPAQSPGCRAQALGPCGGDDARILSANMGRMVAELAPGDSHPRLIPLAEAVVVTASAAKPGDAHRNRPEGDAPAYGANDRTAADLLNLAKVHIPLDLNRRPELTSELVWGRWGIGTDEFNQITAPVSLAALGRHYTGIGDSEAGLYLYRADPKASGPLFPDSLNASVDFRLTRASASFEAGGLKEAASVGGELTIDFARRSFATALLLSSASGGSTELRAGGDIGSNGIFAVRDATQTVAGAVATDGTEAGYLFVRNVDNGVFKGQTLWGVSPGR